MFSIMKRVEKGDYTMFEHWDQIAYRRAHGRTSHSSLAPSATPSAESTTPPPLAVNRIENRQILFKPPSMQARPRRYRGGKLRGLLHPSKTLRKRFHRVRSLQDLSPAVLFLQTTKRDACPSKIRPLRRAPICSVIPRALHQFLHSAEVPQRLP